MNENKKKDSGRDIATDVRKFCDTYRRGNLKFLEMVISQLNDLIDPANPNHGPRSFIIDVDEINKKLCSTARLGFLLKSGAEIDQLPNNDEVYTDDFLGNVENYLETKYKFEFYNDYTFIQIRDDLQRMYDDYDKHGYLPWDSDKDSEKPESKGNEEEIKEQITNMRFLMAWRDDDGDLTNHEVVEAKNRVQAHRIYDDSHSHKWPVGESVIIKRVPDNTPLGRCNGDCYPAYSDACEKRERIPLDILQHVTRFDTSSKFLKEGMPYILEIHDKLGNVIRRRVVVLYEILPTELRFRLWENKPGQGLSESQWFISPEDLEERYNLYQIEKDDI